ncbi:MAG: UDP-N-acetylmuramoyl-L-alanyl-D-glutamate--2,6-diaminopimelate ligase [Candidatus Omnitrophica bacterium]|nr:UDP-N-acetylmuramoyl-L-alanyl-D-glutamate--2,6-diaminopimelate ligase [Candidatus Omnitrophota bacterium]
MRLGDLVSGVDPALSGRFADLEVSAIWDDSRRVTPGSLFAVFSGPSVCGENFIPQAVEKGARVILISEGASSQWEKRFTTVCFLKVSDPRKVFRGIVSNFYGRPSDYVRMIGVTGTNGKTTITYFLESILAVMGRSAGVVGTVNSRVGGKVIPSKNTTPGMLDNQIFLHDLRKAGIDYGVMEVSSHALHQGRVDLIDFRGAIFTNLTGDHLDYHGTMEEYFQAKSRLFTGLGKKAWAVINNDDSYGQRLAGMTTARVITYGITTASDVQAEVEAFDLTGSRIVIRFFDEKIVLRTGFIGLHNVYNILAAFAAGLGEGFPPEKIKEGIESLRWVPGRLERVEEGQDFFLFIDYAHTDDGLKNVLQSLQAVKHHKIIAVFGCGGDRDRTKRPRMGQVACELADLSILTSDNPRTEDPEAIIAEIVPGFSKKTYEIVVDREKAIERALDLADKNDIVLLAGKGHETYQVLKDKTIDFVEKDIVVRLLKEKMKRIERC